MKCLFVFLLAGMPFISIAQQCGTDEVHAHRMKTSSVYRNLMNANNVARPNAPCSSQCDTGGPDTIPVVVHVVSTGGTIGTTNNPEDATIETMIANLNRFFDASYQDSYGLNQSIGVNTKIVFQLAKRTADCQPTNGINRVNAAVNNTYVQYGVMLMPGDPGITQDELSSMAFWDNTRYFNIWLIHKVGNSPYGGFSSFPTGAYSISDGVVITNFLAGSETIAHEAGHYLNLHHTFYGSVNTTCANNTACMYTGDHVCDTDPILKNTNGCNPGAMNPCTGTSYGNAIYNYMSYSCNVIFTPGQVARMREALYQYRYPLIRWGGHLPPPCNTLPVTMSALQLTGNCTVVTLQWSTFQETNNKGFEVQRSSDGVSFHTIGFISGRQYSTIPLPYTFKAGAGAGPSFFRLRQVDMDGRSVVSNIAGYDNDCSPVIKIYPNPATNRLFIEGMYNKTVTIINSMGHIIMQVKGFTGSPIDISRLPAGVYFITEGKAKLSFFKN